MPDILKPYSFPTYITEGELNVFHLRFNHRVYILLGSVYQIVGWLTRSRAHSMSTTAFSVPMIVMSSTIATTVASTGLAACNPATSDAVLQVKSLDEFTSPWVNPDDGQQDFCSRPINTLCAHLSMSKERGKSVPKCWFWTKHIVAMFPAGWLKCRLRVCR